MIFYVTMELNRLFAKDHCLSMVKWANNDAKYGHLCSQTVSFPIRNALRLSWGQDGNSQCKERLRFTLFAGVEYCVVNAEMYLYGQP